MGECVEVTDEIEAKTQTTEFEEIYHDSYAMLRRLLFRFVGLDDLEDCLQEVFYRAWKARQGFRAESLKRTWLYRIAVNVGLDYQRARAREREKTEKYVSELSSERLNTSTKSDQERLLAQALSHLSEQHRSVIVLHYFEDLDLQEISEILEISVGSVKSRLHYARKSLLKVFKKLEVKFSEL